MRFTLTVVKSFTRIYLEFMTVRDAIFHATGQERDKSVLSMRIYDRENKKVIYQFKAI
mgnify:FL=1|jgi:hypothetical protein